jgi:hypothetical protein
MGRRRGYKDNFQACPNGNLLLSLLQFNIYIFQILSACDLPHDELLDFCGRILNYHITRGSLPQEVENGNSSSGTALQKVFMMAKDKEVYINGNC